jgi:hypothetical protein
VYGMLSQDVEARRRRPIIIIISFFSFLEIKEEKIKVKRTARRSTSCENIL